ncbi:MAG: hypothetical protein GXZ05_09635 [Gammaproteobacteria bacterium]|nr:hypothetical protein [Gammaproteobacteria bacterium]
MPTRLRTGGAADAPRRIDTTQDHAAASKYALSHSKPLDLLKKPKAHFDGQQVTHCWRWVAALSPPAQLPAYAGW